MSSRSRKRKRKSDPLYTKRKKKKVISVIETTVSSVGEELDKSFEWQEFYTYVAKDPLATTALICHLLPDAEKADMQKHIEVWLTQHLRRWPEHKQMLRDIPRSDSRAFYTVARPILPKTTGGIVWQDQTSSYLLLHSTHIGPLFHLAYRYHFGYKDLPLDIHKAIFYYQQAMKLGEDHAKYNLAFIYMYGHTGGIVKDEKRALDYFLELKNDVDAFVEISYYYSRAGDSASAIEWAEKAATPDMNNPRGRFLLATLLQSTNKSRAIQLISEFREMIVSGEANWCVSTTEDIIQDADRLFLKLTSS